MPTLRNISEPDADVSLSDLCGTNKWFWSTNMLKFVMKGDCIVTLEVYDSIQLTMRVDMKTSEFFADNGETQFIDRLAAVLRIPSYRIRVLSFYEGSTVLKIAVDQDAKEPEPAEELKTVYSTIVQQAQANTLDVGVPLLEVQAFISER
jgi:hypothetical protein